MSDTGNHCLKTKSRAKPSRRRSTGRSSAPHSLVLCLLCTKYCKNVNTAAFECRRCCNLRVDARLLALRELKKQINDHLNCIKQQIEWLQPTQRSLLDKKACLKQSQSEISRLKQCVQRSAQQKNQMQQQIASLRTENQQRLARLQQLKKMEMATKWSHCLHLMMTQNLSIYKEYDTLSQQCRKLSNDCLLRLFLYFPMNAAKQAPRPHAHQDSIHGHDQLQICMVQNVVVPSLFTLANIRDFYAQNTAFRYPIIFANASLPAAAVDKQKQKHKHKHKHKQRTHHPYPKTGLAHDIHAEHAICAALYHIVAFLLRACRYVRLDPLYAMHISKKYGCPLILDHGGKKYRLQYECDDGDDDDAGGRQSFEYALSLLEENVTQLCVHCGVARKQLKSYAFVENLICVRRHLAAVSTEKQNSDCGVDRSYVASQVSLHTQLLQTSQSKDVGENENENPNIRIEESTCERRHMSGLNCKRQSSEEQELSDDSASNDMSIESDEWEKI